MGKLANTAPTPPPTRCSLGRVEDDPALDPDDVTALRAALGTVELTNAAIIAWLARNGFRLNKDTVAKHRAGTCRCSAA